MSNIILLDAWKGKVEFPELKAEGKRDVRRLGAGCLHY
jgi:hypothetical protein